MIKLNGVQVVPTIFPDNTSQVWKLPEDLINSGNNFLNAKFATVKWEFSSEAEFLHLAQLKDLLDKNGFVSVLVLKYLPYARQDKDISNTSTFALRTFSKLLNTLNFQEVVILDPHSDMSTRWINNSRDVYPVELVDKVFRLTNSDIICLPDSGAFHKYQQIYRLPKFDARKTRNPLTGQITGCEFNPNYVGPTSKVLIVDDICDFGNTFILLSKELYKAGVKEVNLFVTHGLFTGGLQILLDAGIKNIYTKDGKAELYNNNIVYDIKCLEKE